MLNHHNDCDYNYGTTEETFEIDSIQGVYGHKSRRIFLILWRDHRGQDSWEPGDLLNRNGCRATVKYFSREYF